MLMTAQIRVDDHDREAILPQAVAENLSQPVRVLQKFFNSLLKFSNDHESQTSIEPRLR